MRQQSVASFARRGVPCCSMSRLVPTVALLLGMLGVTFSQDFTPLRTATYEKILDDKFGGERDTTGGFDYRVVLRFIPSQGRELEIVIGKHISRNAFSVVRFSPSGERSILSQAEELSRTYGDSATEIEQHISVDRKECFIPARDVERLISKLKKTKLSPWVKTGVYLTGTDYELSIVGSERTYIHRIGNSAERDDQNPSLIRWMNLVRARTENCAPAAK